MTLRQLRPLFSSKIVRLFVFVRTSHFLYNGHYFEQKDGVVMGSPLSPVMANFFVEFFEHKALQNAPYKPPVFLQYVDDTFLVWPHGNKVLGELFSYLNRLHPNIQFTVDIKGPDGLPFWMIWFIGKVMVTMGHKVYRKPTHTNLYLHATSCQQSANQQAVLYIGRM